LVEGHEVMACAEPPSGSTGNDSFCLANDDCTSGICYSDSCRPPCCGAATCATQSPPYGACGYFNQGGALKEYVPGCLYPSGKPPGTAKIGEACTTGAQCASYVCDPVAHYCTDVCCTDNDCTAYAPYTVCRPATNPRYLTCQKPG
jgi:hypothetical protein